jgi:dTDP-4-dehydrorhamnose 3,5-epimerase
MGKVTTRSMTIRPLPISDTYLLVPVSFGDQRGRFLETLRTDVLAEAVGHPVQVVQTNQSISRRGVLRGIHATAVPDGQAKVVTCLRGAVLDFVVDLRVGSVSFARWAMTVLDARSGASVYLGEGIGHAFYALEDDTCVQYLCSESYVPEQVITVNVFDPEIGIGLDLPEPPILSETDAAAPSLADLRAAGRLPRYEDCLNLHAAPTRA